MVPSFCNSQLSDAMSISCMVKVDGYFMKCHMSQKLSSVIKHIKSSGLFGVHIALYYVIWYVVYKVTYIW